MTTYTAITSGQTDSESPIDVILMTLMRNNPIAITEGAAGAPSIVYAALSLSNDIAQSDIASNAIGTDELKTSSSNVSSSSTSGTVLTLPGGAVGFYPTLRSNDASGKSRWGWNFSGSYAEFAAHVVGTTYANTINLATDSATYDARASQTYVAACPPHNHGDGVVAQYVFALIDNATSKVEATYIADDAPWHNNGPTNVRPNFYDAQGRQWRWEPVFETITEKEDMTDYASAGIDAGWASLIDTVYVDSLWYSDYAYKYPTFIHVKSGTYSSALSWKELCLEQNISITKILGAAIPRKRPTGERRIIEVTQAMKDTDMALIPHPFTHNDLTGKTVVLLDPVHDEMYRIRERQEFDGFDTTTLLHNGGLKIGNQALNRNGPPGVIVAPFNLA